jgi:hypothetical protein
MIPNFFIGLRFFLGSTKLVNYSNGAVIFLF